METKKVFISYGRDNLQFFADKLSNDLNMNPEIETIIDKRMGVAVAFDSWIQDQLNNSSCVLFLMSKHSTRRRESVCLDEIAYARCNALPIIPVLIEDCSPPFLVSRINWLDARDSIDTLNKNVNQTKYLNILDKITKLILEGFTDELFDGTTIDLKRKLSPFDFSLILASSNGSYFARPRLENKISEWIDEGGNLLWLSAQPGSGKSYFCSHLANTDSRVKGIHFCREHNSETCVAKKIFTSLAFNLYTQIEEYGKCLEENLDFSSYDKNDISKNFYDLFVKSTSTLNVTEKCILIVDGLDEMNPYEVQEFCTALFDNKDRLPKWLKIIIASRNELNVSQMLSFVKKIELFNTDEDMKNFILFRVSLDHIHIDDSALQRLIELSQGNFLYVKTVLDVNAGGNMDIASLKTGIGSVLSLSFSRAFLSIEEYNKIPRKLLQVLVALQDAVEVGKIADILQIDEYELQSVLACFGSLIEIRDNALYLYHKSLLDWLTDTTNTRYYVSAIEGDKLICQWIKTNSFSFIFDDYIRHYGMEHLFHAKEYSTIFELLELFGDSLDDTLCRTLVKSANPKTYADIAQFIHMGFKKYQETFPIRKIIRCFVEYGIFDNLKAFFLYFVTQSSAFSWVIPYSELIHLRMSVKIQEAYDMPASKFEGAPTDVYADYLYYHAEASRELGKYTEALEAYSSSKEYCSSPQRFAYYMSTIKIADIYFVFQKNNEALDIINSIDIDKENLEGLFAAERVKGHIYNSMKNIKEAYEHYYESLKIAKEMGKMYAIAESYNSIATTLPISEARDYLEKAISICSQNDFKLELGKAYTEMAKISHKLGETDKAIDYAKQALGLQLQVGYQNGILKAKRILALSLSAKKEFDQAIEYFKENLDYIIDLKMSSNLLIDEIRNYMHCLNRMGIYLPYDLPNRDKIYETYAEELDFISDFERLELTNKVIKHYIDQKSNDYKIGYHNQNYVVETDGKKYILRIPVEDFDNVDIHLFSENDILLFLEENQIDIRAPKYIGSIFFEGQIVAVHSFVEGEQLREALQKDPTLNSEYIVKFAQTLTTLHKFRKSPTDSLPYFNVSSFYQYDRNFIFELSSKWFERYKEMYIGLGFPEDISLLLGDRSDSLFENPFSLTHCDFHTGNVLIQSDNIALIDWELTQFTDPLYDVAIHLHKMYYAPEAEELFLNTYFSAFSYDKAKALEQIKTYRVLEEVKSCVIDAIRLVKEFETFSEEKMRSICNGYMKKLVHLESSQSRFTRKITDNDLLFEYFKNQKVDV